MFALHTQKNIEFTPHPEINVKIEDVHITLYVILCWKTSQISKPKIMTRFLVL